MRKSLKVGLVCCCVSLVAFGCSPKQEENQSMSITSKDGELVLLENSISPNEEYVTSKDDIVTYTISVSHESNSRLVVKAKSNSEFFKPIQYTIETSQSITKDDIDVNWTTLMGDTNATEEDQLGVETITIRANSSTISERKINFVKGTVDIITETIKQNK